MFIQKNFRVKQIIIYDATGKKVLTENMHLMKGNNNFNIYLPSISDGIYFVKMNVEGMQSTVKVCVTEIETIET